MDRKSAVLAETGQPIDHPFAMKEAAN